MPKSSMAISAPERRRLSKCWAAVLMSSIRPVSVTSSSRLRGGRRYICIRLLTTRGSSAWCNCTVDKLTAMRMSLKPWSCQSRNCLQA
ncbi:hypothetical protein D3C84_782980 [compost metagenome]